MVPGIVNLSDVREIESVPLERRNLPSSTLEAIRRGSAENPNKVALHFFMHGAEYKDVIFYTYEDLIHLITQTANMFHGLGIGKTDVISMILPNLPQSLFTIWGGQAAGIINPINPLLEAEKIAEIMNAAGSKLVVTLAPFIGTDIWQKVASIAGQVPTLEAVLRVDLTHYLSTFQRWAVKWVMLREDKGPKLQIPVYDFGQMARKYTGERLNNERQIEADDIALYFPNSQGSKPLNLAKITHFNQVVNAWSLAESLSLAADQQVLCGEPLYQAPNLIFSSLLPWMQGGSVILGSPSGFNDDGLVGNIWEIVEFYKINTFSADQSFFQTLSHVPKNEADISSFRFAICLADENLEENIPAFADQIEVPILLSYGILEAAGFSSISSGAEQRKEGSIGFRLPYQEMKIAEIDDQGQFIKYCASEEKGVIILRGPNIFTGYVDENGQPPLWVDTNDGQGSWVNSGKIGWQDSQGYFWLAEQ